jgi:hypothetical protein
VDAALGCDQDEYCNAPCAALWDSYDAFTKTVPTTLAGLFAMLLYAEEIVKNGDGFFEDGPIYASLASAAKAWVGDNHEPPPASA